MSENLDLVRSIFAAWERGDFGSAEWADSEIEYVAADGPDPDVYTGVPAMAASWHTVLSAWEEVRVLVEEYRELEDRRVLVLMSWTGRGRGSGFDLAHVPWNGANLFHVRNGSVTRLVLYWDRDRALADVGLAE